MKFITWLVFSISLVLFLSVYISPEYLPYVGLLPFFIPAALIVNFFLFAILTLSWRKTAFLPLIALVIGYRFIFITFQLNPKNPGAEGLTILSYNVHLFDYKSRTAGKFDPNVFTWLKENDSDIKVFQEFFNDNTTASRDALKILGKDAGYDVAYHIIQGNPKKRSYGLAIFSKYPVLNHGKVFDNSRTNGAIFADLLIKSDTIRIYNAHLESMKIESEKLDNLEGVKDNYRQTMGKLNRGSLARSQQLKVLVEHIHLSPHPVILTGDLNELPYSYTYFKLSENLNNAFEVAGRGFGFTYNRILFFLRIDHIFYSNELKAIQFKTHREVDYSDHYPISATFTWDGYEE